MIVKDVKPGDIRRDGDTQPRAYFDNPTVEEYIEAIENGDTMPPLDVFYDGKNYWLADGFHRFTAITKLYPRRSIQCNVYKGNRRDAQWHSFGANQAHGLRRTNEDKAKAVKAALLHPNGNGMSDNAIAKHIGVSQDMVSRYRNKMEADGALTENVSRTGRDGRKMNTAKIGKRSTRAENPAKKQTSGVKVFKPKRRGRKLSRMVSLSLPVNKPEITAAALQQAFPVSYIETLVQILSKSIQEEKGKQL